MLWPGNDLHTKFHFASAKPVRPPPSALVLFDAHRRQQPHEVVVDVRVHERVSRVVRAVDLRHLDLVFPRRILHPLPSTPQPHGPRRRLRTGAITPATILNEIVDIKLFVGGSAALNCEGATKLSTAAAPKPRPAVRNLPAVVGALPVLSSTGSATDPMAMDLLQAPSVKGYPQQVTSPRRR